MGPTTKIRIGLRSLRPDVAAVCLSLGETTGAVRADLSRAMRGERVGTIDLDVLTAACRRSKIHVRAVLGRTVYVARGYGIGNASLEVRLDQLGLDDSWFV